MSEEEITKLEDQQQALDHLMETIKKGQDKAALRDDLSEAQ